MIRAWVLACFAPAVLLQPACTNRAWYEGFRETQREQCYRQPSQSQIDRCLEEVNAASYDDYKRSRESSSRAPR